MVNAVVCCLKIRRTISGKVDAVISCKVQLYLSWTLFPLDSCVWVVFQCLRYIIRVSGSSGRIWGFIADRWLTDRRTVGRLGTATSWLLWITIGWSRGWRSLHHWSHFRSFVQSPVTEYVFPSIKILTTHGTGDRVVVGFLVVFSVVCPLKLLPTHITGIGVWRMDMGFHVAGETALLRKLLAAFVTHLFLKR